MKRVVCNKLTIYASSITGYDTSTGELSLAQEWVLL